MSALVIRHVDGSVVKRLPPGDVSAFTDQLNEITRDVATMDAVPFAAKWIAERD